jgi:hypothetical protein
MVGGVVTGVAVRLLVYPAIYFIWRGWGLWHTRHDSMAGIPSAVQPSE